MIPPPSLAVTISPAPTRWPKRLQPVYLPLVVLSISLTITFWLWQDARQNSQQDLQARFDFGVREVAASIEQRMKFYEQVLRGVDGLMASARIDRQEFRRYIEKLQIDENYPGLHGVGYALIVPAVQREAHLATMHADGLTQYTITPTGQRDLYSPVVFIEPFVGSNPLTLGADLYVEPVSRTAMERSRDLGRPIISRLMPLAAETDKPAQAGLAMYLPVYKEGLPRDSFAERRANIAGWAYATFRMNELMDGVLGESAELFSIQIFDGEVASPQTLMYDSAPGDNPATGTLLRATRYVSIGGHTWTTIIGSLPALETQIDADKPLFVARLMLGASLLLTMLSWLFAYGRARTESDAEKLAAAQASYRSMFDNALDAVFLLRGNLFIDCNTKAQALLGCDREQIVGQSPVRFSPPTQADGRSSGERAERIKNSLYIGEQVFEWLFQRHDGSQIYCDVALRRMEIDGETLFLANIHDISERKNAEERFKRTSSELEAILNNALVGICYICERRHQWVNNKFAEMMGFSPEELIGQLTLIHFPDEKSWLDIGELAYPQIASGTPFCTDWQMKRKDGSIFWAQIFGRSVDPENLDKGTIWTYLDISERKHAEAETQAALAQQKELNQLKTRFVSMTSHEFRTPLATIMSSTELLKYYSDKLPAEERLEVFGSIEKAVKRMTRMLEDILLIGKADAERIEFQPEPLALRPFCEELLNEARLAVDSSGSKLGNFEFQLIGERPDVCLDQRLLHHILSNLLSNAVKYSPAGKKVFFGVVCREREVEFTVADEGIGMASEDLSHLFKTFYRASNVGNIAGTGLGLAIVKRSIDVHGGSIKVDSILGTGTRFVVTLPISDAPAPST